MHYNFVVVYVKYVCVSEEPYDKLSTPNIQTAVLNIVFTVNLVQIKIEIKTNLMHLHY
jgi:hypothetical protein